MTVAEVSDYEQAWADRRFWQIVDAAGHEHWDGRAWSANQLRLLSMWERPDASFVIVPGPAQCGKTEAAIPGFLTWLHYAHSESAVVMLAKGRTQLAQVVKPRVETWLREHGYPLRWRWDGADYADVPSHVPGETNRVWLIVAGEKGKTTGGASQTAERIQGFTLSGAYIDELTNCAPALVEMLLSRFVAMPGAKIVGTCNPEGPTHWLKRNWIDRIDSGELPGEHIPFSMADNPQVDRQHAEAMAAGWTGAFRRRMLLGEWAATEGAIYPHFVIRTPTADMTVARWEVAIDYAPHGLGHALLIGWIDGRPWVLDELRTDGQMESMDSLDKMAATLARWAGSRRAYHWLLPVDGRQLAPYVEARVGRLVREPVMERLWGINATRVLLESQLLISRRCVQLIGELQSYRWSEDKADEPDKSSAAGAHAVDALRYWCATYTRDATGTHPVAPQTSRR